MNRLLTLRDAADLLRINERTALRLANSGELPAARVGGQWRVHPTELERWFLESRPGAAPPGDRAPLFTRGLILPQHAARSILEVFEAIAEQLAATGQLIYPDVFREALREREEMMSTGIGRGVAIPHVRHAINGLFRHPVCVCITLANAIEWNSLDNKPVDLVFAVAAPTNSLHLSTLARVMKVTREARLCAKLRAQADPDAVLELLGGAAGAP